MAHGRQVLLFIAAGVSSAAVGAAGLCCRAPARLAAVDGEAPDYVICLHCETPCYVLEWKEGTLVEASCTYCDNDDGERFARPEDIDEATDATASQSSALAEHAQAVPRGAA